jgi:tRNA A-37 threonylcarbamoyl transferase component Bud32
MIRFGRMNPGEIFGGYEVLEFLGKGAYSRVYRARQLSTNREVALKLLLPASLDDTLSTARFSREMKLAVKLSHPNLVTTYDVGSVESDAYIAMEWMKGGSLETFVTRRAPAPWPLAFSVAQRIASGLAHLHELEILHRDLKPANVLLGLDGAVKVADFGCARTSSQTRMTAPGAVIGTLVYLSPEVLDNASGATPAADIWALGVILYRLLTGRLHVEGANFAIWVTTLLSGRITPPHELVEIPREISDFVMGLLAMDIEARPAALEVADELSRLVEEAGSPVESYLTGETLVGRRARIAPRLPVARALLVDNTPKHRKAGFATLALVACGIVKMACSARTGAVLPVVVHSASAASRPADPGTYPAWGQWRRFVSELPQLEGNSAAARARIADLKRRSPLDLGPVPDTWAQWIRLGQWLSDPARTRHPPRSRNAQAGPIEWPDSSVVLTYLDDFTGVLTNAFVANTLLRLVIYPDEARLWLVLGRICELTGGLEEARAAYREALERLRLDKLKGANAILSIALARAYFRASGQDVKVIWPRWANTTQQFLFKPKLMLNRNDPAEVGFYEQLMRGCMAYPRLYEAAIGNLACLQMEERHNPRAARDLLEEGLRQVPESKHLREIFATYRCGLVDVFDLLEKNARAPAEEKLKRVMDSDAWSREHPSPLVFDVLDQGSQTPWVLAAAELAFSSPNNHWKEAAGAMRSTAGKNWMRQHLPSMEALLRKERALPPFLLEKALWQSRRGEYRASLDTLLAIGKTPNYDGLERLGAERHSLCLLRWPGNEAHFEVLARPLWMMVMGKSPGPDVLELVRKFEILDLKNGRWDRDESPLCAYWEALRRGDLETAVRVAGGLFEKDPHSVLWGLTLVWWEASRHGAGLKEAVRRVQELHRQQAVNLWLVAELNEFLSGE